MRHMFVLWEVVLYVFLLMMLHMNAFMHSDLFVIKGHWPLTHH